MHPPEPLPTALSIGAFRVDEAPPLGVSRSRLRAADLTSPHHGVRMLGAAGRDALSRAQAFAPLLLPDEAFSHGTAALLIGMRTPMRMRDAPLHVTTIGSRRARRRPGVIGHRAADRLLWTTALGLAVTEPVSTWLDLASELSLVELIVMGDGLLARRDPVVGVAELEARVLSAVGQRSIAKVRAAMAHLRPGTDSGRETQLRLLLLAAGIREPEVNGAIRDESGRVIAHGDLVWREERVIVEYDGDHHRTDRRQFSIDIDRIGRLQAAGWHVIRVDAALFDRGDELVERIRAALGRAR
jgi:hypothetical protein